MASTSLPTTESIEQISYKAIDWKEIGADIINKPEGTVPAHLDDFAHHVFHKAATAPRPDFVFGETLTKRDATEVRKAAKDLDISEATQNLKGDEYGHRSHM